MPEHLSTYQRHSVVPADFADYHALLIDVIWPAGILWFIIHFPVVDKQT
jgi:hypothetical protein